MLELLSYEPFEGIKGVEREYILKILDFENFKAENEEKLTTFEAKYRLLNNETDINKIYMAFLSTFPDYKEINELYRGWFGNRDSKDLDWLRSWLSDFKNGKSKVTYPVLFKKICYYLLLNIKVTQYEEPDKGKYSLVDSNNEGYSIDITDEGRPIYDRELGLIIGLSSGQITNKVKIFTKWNLYSSYRMKSETHNYSRTSLNRNGAKAEYLTSLIQKLYYESARQTKNKDYRQEVDPSGWYAGLQQKQAVSTLKSDLPVFVDCFAGTGTVSASVNTKYKVVNDLDKNWIALIVMATKYPQILLDAYKEMLISVLQGSYEGTIQQYFNYQPYLVNGNRSKLQYIDDTNFNKVFINSYRPTNDVNGKYYVAKTLFDVSYNQNSLMGTDMTSDWNKSILDNITLVPYNRDFYQRVCNMFQYASSILEDSQGYLLRTTDANGQVQEGLNIDFNNEEDIENNIGLLCTRACYIIYKHSFGAFGGSGEPNIKMMDTSSFTTMLRTFYKIKGDKEELVYSSANLMDLAVSDLSNKKVFWKEWINGLKGKETIIGSLSFSDLFISDNAFYYADSPYWLTSGYDVFFPDELHVELLDKLRDSKFNWLFSMQYFKGSKWTEGGSDSRKPQAGKHIIKDYNNYYRGFLEEFRIDGDFFVSDLESDKEYPELYVLLFDKDEIKKNTSAKKDDGIEIIVSNFNADGVIPYGAGVVQIPFADFLVEAENDAKYQEIYQKAVELYEARIKQRHNL